MVLEALLYAIQSGEGILKVVGEVGSGKTMLCRMLEQRLPDTVEVVYLANPKLTPQDILYAVAFELELPVSQETPRLVLMQQLQAYLLQQHAANKSVLVIIEEAQSMPVETLEEIRLFSNLETHEHKLMQIILFGQPELDKNLQSRDIRQLRERITHSFYLSPLTPEEVSDYIRHRLQAAGCPAPQVFTRAAERLIAKASGGLTRRINILADKAMLVAYSESGTATRPRSLSNQLTSTVTVDHVKAAIRDSDYDKPTHTRRWLYGIAATLFIGLLVWLAVALIYPTIEITTSPRPVAPDAQAPGSLTSTNTNPGLQEWPDIVNERRDAVADWLNDTGRGDFALQILSLPRDESAYLADALEVLDQAGLLEESFACLMPGANGPMWRLVYGNFDSVESARSGALTLPGTFRVNTPFVQNINRLDCL
ncbi:Sporulation domain protein [Pseudohongiella spirulinae]|uniref:Sporulation domain protein n=1 Tax=Pseudohongiella spirulinae TaxID=1249552 RepID=A0A0S2KAK4_9GAMM|nr:Sporulation domain protein [Pseudohongiella spirulinae]